MGGRQPRSLQPRPPPHLASIIPPNPRNPHPPSRLQRLLQRNPSLRPSASEALADPWVADGGAASDAPLNGSVVARLQVRRALWAAFRAARTAAPRPWSRRLFFSSAPPDIAIALAPRSRSLPPAQRFATYSHLKQLVLRMITEEMRRQGTAPTLASALQVRSRGVAEGNGKAGKAPRPLLRAAASVVFSYGFRTAGP
jgi:hypothetical protein